MEEMKRLGWRFPVRRTTNSQHLTNPAEAEERTVIDETLDTTARTTGQRPIGWSSRRGGPVAPAAIELLRKSIPWGRPPE